VEIVRTRREDCLELAIEGRLDAYWAQHLVTSVGEVMRQGTHAVRLNLAKTVYISSAGIGVLVDLHKQFQAVNGSFLVTEPSRAVQNVLKMVGLAAMLVGDETTPAAVAPMHTVERIERRGASFEIHSLAGGGAMECRVMGHPERLAGASFTAADCVPVEVQEDRLLLGLGAFGDGFDACRDRFGEFLAVAGAAACQPTDGTNFPDYMIGSGDFVPSLTALYGLSCDGAFAKLVRFETSATEGPAPLNAIVEACLEIAGATTAAVVVLAESAGLMGAMLRRPPVQSGKLFAYPDIRQWLSFSPERCFPHALALIAGVVSSAPHETLRPFVRSLSRAAKLSGHLHAAAFGYRPLQKGHVEMKGTIRGLFSAGGLQGVLHLLADDRETGGGESELLRGACWISPIQAVSR
jgi:anti-anti-sigma factor